MSEKDILKERNEVIERLQIQALTWKGMQAFKDFVKEISEPNNYTDITKKVYKIIDDIVLEKGKFKRTLKKGTKYYRARICDMSNIKPDSGIKYDNGKMYGYNEENSKEPLIGISSEGRNNIKGASYLYIASNPQTACMEVKPQIRDFISLAEFKVKRDIKIIDFYSDKLFERFQSELYDMSLGEFFTRLMFAYTVPNTNPEIYKVTQNITDYIRKSGIDGIGYRSFFVKSGINYTIFNCHPNIIKYERSKIVEYYGSTDSFWDFNEKKQFYSNDLDDIKFNEDNAIKTMESLPIKKD